MTQLIPPSDVDSGPLDTVVCTFLSPAPLRRNYFPRLIAVVTRRWERAGDLAIRRSQTLKRPGGEGEGGDGVGWGGGGEKR